MDDCIIPELPDEVGRECLIRVPYDAFATARSVCKLWKQELDCPSFHRLRKAAGLARTVVALVQSEPVPASTAKAQSDSSQPMYRVVLFEPAAGTWTTLPPVRGRPDGGLPLFCQIAAVGRELVVVGGWDPKTWAATDEVHVYDFASASWRQGARMPEPRRSFFACAASEGRRTVFVAGGHDESKNALRTALAYDVASDKWVALPNMARPRDECQGLILHNSFRVVGGYATEAQGLFEGSAEAFDVNAWRWGPVEEGELEAGACPRTCAAGGDGLLYSCRADRRVVVKDGAGWRAAAELPGDVRAVSHAVAWEGGLMVLGSGTHFEGALVCYVLEDEKGGRRWRKVELPAEYCGHVHAGCCLEL